MLIFFVCLSNNYDMSNASSYSLLFTSLLFVFSQVGAAVADAAARPFHWLYDTKKLEEIMSK